MPDISSLRPSRRVRHLRQLLVAAACCSVVAVVAATAAEASGATRHSSHAGTVDVLYAGSLVDAMQRQLVPAFEKATGYTVNQVSAGSDELASEIKAKTQVADVFVSASPSVNAKLEGPANGNWVSWYSPFASSALVLGYNPKSRFAAALRTRPWWQVVEAKGFLLGWTDSATDPKGVLAIDAMTEAAKAHHDPALAALAKTTRTVFPEQTLVGRLQAGQLDAGFFYAVEAAAAKLPTVTLGATSLKGDYTVTVLNRAPHAAGAAAFVAFLVGPKGSRILAADGVTLAHPLTVVGDAKAVPASLRSALSGA